ncbi:bifunctional 3-(3-hydroxy-phenyl)propionate/3-hydroxycinnamic acid hydroxylase [Rhizobium sp. L1K21]|uniref:bifunctional 3-(3-hydroxy-phenyl)propionate/3-hydroxycinnamic acid hydroxylase n=1 Tax=Rhizobium sp. L1K21 TaxID=2954933 RepID=UPI002092F051|nr:bifunctional 3-(3-hydroxy-phenyl)propionate/3-hydroxycinnamic acid hydroxylase [Rhizobium sp. L1K21]
MSTQKSKREITCDVLVVGVGPVGAAVAALIAQKGHSVVAVERDLQLYPLPRAVGFDGDIMRIFQRMGLVDKIAPHVRFSPYYDFLSAEGETLLSYDRSTGRHPSGWLPNVTFYQPAIEEALREQIEVSPAGTLLLGYTFRSLTQDESGVSAEFQRNDETINVRCKYLVGCDGARSQVRAELGVELEDFGFDEPWLVVDFLADDLSGLPDRNVQICDPQRPATYMQMGPGRYRWEFMVLPDDDPAALKDEQFVRTLLSNCGVTRNDPIERLALYRFHGLIAKQWKKGRVLLAGDSAHQMPPFAGQGFCSGLRDAFALAWRIDLVLAGRASEPLLASYEEERKPQVEFMINSSIRLGQIVCTTDVERATARDTLMLAERKAGSVPPPPMSYPPLESGFFIADQPGAGQLFPQPTREDGAKSLRFDDLSDGRPTLISRHFSQLAALGSIEDIWLSAVDRPELEPFRQQLEAWLEAHGAEAVLIRPDFYVFATGSPSTLLDSYRKTVAP